MRKLHLKILICLLCALSFAALSAYAIEPQYETIQIGLAYGVSAKSEVTLSSVCGFDAGYMDGSHYTPLEYGFDEVSLTITPNSSASVCINGIACDLPYGNYALLPRNGEVNIDGTVYRGGVKIIPDESGKLTVVNFVNINDYIAGVVGREMSPSWPLEALKAQAVCARSYAVKNWHKHSSHGFNLCNTQDCQVYLGTGGESESTISASEQTKDQIIMHGSSVAEALYSSSNGGSLAYSKYVWGNDIPYLTASYDPYDAASQNPRSSWDVTLTKEQIKSKLDQKDIDIGEIVDMKVTGADEYGRTYEVTIFGTNGQYPIKNDQTRSFFGLYSQKYTITPVGDSSDAIQPVFAITKDGVKSVTSFTIKGSRTTLDNNDYISVKSSTDSVQYQTKASPAAPESFVINGSGWGHGLGMSQYGAKVMAEQGFDYVDILKFYYNGVELR